MNDISDDQFINDTYQFHDYEIKNVSFDSINNIITISICLDKSNYFIKLVDCTIFVFQTDHIQNVIDRIYFDFSSKLLKEISYFNLFQYCNKNENEKIFLITPASGVTLFAKCENVYIRHYE